jgi:hypothetical protein
MPVPEAARCAAPSHRLAQSQHASRRARGKAETEPETEMETERATGREARVRERGEHRS